MPYFPTVEETKTAQQVTDVFRGYHHDLRIGDGEFYEMQNLTSDYYPMLASRKRRGVLDATLTAPGGMLAKETLAYVDNGKLYYNGYEIVGLRLTAGEKQLVSMGAYLLIWPDKKYLNTKDMSDFGDMENTVAVSCAESNVRYDICDANGAVIQDIATTQPEEPEGGQYWLDTTQTPHSLRRYSVSSATWATVPTVYVRIQATGIGMGFKQYDGVKLSGIAYPGESAAVKEQYDALNSTKAIYAVDPENNYIVVVGLVDVAVTQTTGTVTVSRSVPDMDYVCESQNRVWGCKYGMVDGKAVNELYCCALGDFKNWNRFLGIATDAWAASVGSDGAWTGAANYLGYPTFFKENVIHRIAISSAGAHQVTETVGRGVQNGSGKSLCVVNEVLYYKAREGVCAYDGSFPSAVGEALGDVRYHNAVGGGCGGKYYLSMQDGANAWHLFCYDTAKGLWHAVLYPDGRGAVRHRRGDKAAACPAWQSGYAGDGGEVGGGDGPDRLYHSGAEVCEPVQPADAAAARVKGGYVYPVRFGRRVASLRPHGGRGHKELSAASAAPALRPLPAEDRGRGRGSGILICKDTGNGE